MVVNRWISEKLPTAYMVLPHCTSWRTVSVVLVGASFGVPVAGVAETGPVCAAFFAEPLAAVAAAGTWSAQHPTAAMPAITAYRRPYCLRSSSVRGRVLCLSVIRPPMAGDLTASPRILTETKDPSLK